MTNRKGFTLIELLVVIATPGEVNSALLDFSTRKAGLKELWQLWRHRSYDLTIPPPERPEWMKKF